MTFEVIFSKDKNRNIDLDRRERRRERRREGKKTLGSKLPPPKNWFAKVVMSIPGPLIRDGGNTNPSYQLISLVAF